MYCPQCRAEYKARIEECADCKVPLVSELPPKPFSSPVLRLKKATLITIIATSYIFITRTLNTFIPDLFSNLRVAQINSALSLLAALGVFFFFVYFLREYVPDKSNVLKNGASAGIAGASLLVLLHIKELFLLFSRYPSFGLLKSDYCNVLSPLIVASLILVFFVMFYKDIIRKNQHRLKNALLLAIVGSAVGVIAQVLVVLNYIVSGTYTTLNILFSVMPFLFLPMVLITYATGIYFFSVFYLEQK